MLTVDRTRSGDSSFEAGFAETVQAPLRAVNGKVRLHIYVDESTLEVFGADGETVISSILFPEATSNGLELYVKKGDVMLDQAVMYPMASVWRDEDAGRLANRFAFCLANPVWMFRLAALWKRQRRWFR